MKNPQECNFNFGLELAIDRNNEVLQERMVAREESYRKNFNKIKGDFFVVSLLEDIAKGYSIAINLGLSKGKRECSSLPDKCALCDFNHTCYGDIERGNYFKTPLE